MTSLDERIQELVEYEAEHGHMLVPQKQGSLGKWVINTRLRKGGLKSQDIKKLDEIGFVWVAPKGPEKEKLIAWGKQFKWLVNLLHSTIAGKSVPAAAWCDEQRGLDMDGKLDQGFVEKLTGIGFDFFGSTEDMDGKEPATKRQRKDTDEEVFEKEVKSFRDEVNQLKGELKAIKDEVKALKEEVKEIRTHD